MRNATAAASFFPALSPAGYLQQQAFGTQDPSHGGGGGRRLITASPRPPMVVEQVTTVPPPTMRPLLLHDLASLNLLLLLVYVLLLLLAKLFARLPHADTSTSRDDHGCDDVHRTEISTDVIAADMAGVERRRPDTLFWFDEAVLEDSTMLGLEGKDHLYTSTPAAHCLQAEHTFPAEEYSTSRPRRHITFSPPPPTPTRNGVTVVAGKQGPPGGVVVSAAADERNIPVDVASPENVSFQEKERGGGGGGGGSRGGDSRDEHGEEEEEEEEEKEKGDKAAGYSEDRHHVKLFVNSRGLADTKQLMLEGAAVAGGGGRLRDEDPGIKEKQDSSRFGASTLTSESTSKSSVEWQSSTAATKDWDLSSSSRRSSARWESYTLFRKYDEDMVYFHRVGAQKLTETESFRSIKYQPRSMSARIAHSLAPKPPVIGLRDPYPELERVYVAQICLTWEALNWNYTSFRRHNGGDGMMLEARCCPARVAQEFQQFQVLLHRFIENEPYESGRRPEVYARMKNSSPKLLLVPEFREEEDEKDDLISAVQFLHILEESIRTFMAFLRGDRRSHYQMFRDMVKRRASAADQSFIIALKKANKKKKSRFKDLTRPRRCLRRTKLREEEELSMLLGLIDLKVVSRVLRMPELTEQQLHWCQEKMKRVTVDDVPGGKLHRDPSPLFFPAH